MAGLPNSRMSAPAMKALPAPISSTPATALSAWACAMAAASPWRTATPSALTGGLLTVTTRMAPARAVVTTDSGVAAPMRESPGGFK